MAEVVSDGQDHPYAGRIMSRGEMKDLLAKFGMMVGLDETADADRPLQTAQLAHALVGVLEAHGTRAEDAYRPAGAGPGDLVRAALMAFAGANCRATAD